MSVKSPLTGSESVVFEKNIPVTSVINAYKKSGLDIARFFEGLTDISIYKCLGTGYRFYYPFNISGDGDFYRQLQKFPWYYMDWKWEHENALKYISADSTVLEIGCAKGSFVKKLTQKGVKSLGLELNSDAVNYGAENGLNILNETIQQHAIQNPEKYDVICSFQVVEHIAEIKNFMKSSVAALKKGGKLIISVPNNDSFLGLDNNFLNMPPHHMGLWNELSLRNMSKLFNLHVLHTDFEPLQAYHKEYFKNVTTTHLAKKNSLSGRILSFLFPLTFPLNLFLFKKEFKAFTIQIALQKN